MWVTYIQGSYALLSSTLKQCLVKKEGDKNDT